MSKTILYCQGDIAFIKRRQIPAEMTAAKPTDRHILAYGEATGHHHSVLANRAKFFVPDRPASGAALLIGFLEAGPQHQGPLPATLLSEDEQSFVANTKLGRIKFGKADAVFKDGAVQIGPFSLVEHQEHDGLALVRGIWEVRRQREATDDDEPRIVAD